MYNRYRPLTRRTEAAPPNRVLSRETAFSTVRWLTPKCVKYSGFLGQGGLQVPKNKGFPTHAYFPCDAIV